MSRVVSNGAIEKNVVREKADFSARRKSFVDVVNIDKEEEGPRTVPERTGVRKRAIDNDSLSVVF